MQVPTPEGYNPQSGRRLCGRWRAAGPGAALCVGWLALLIWFPAPARARQTTPTRAQSVRVPGETCNYLPTGEHTPGDRADDACPMSPQDWTDLILSSCSQDDRNWENSLAALERQLKLAAESEEQLAFPRAELLARRKHLDWQRLAHFARLDSMLLGQKAESLEAAAEDYRRAAHAPRPRGKTPLHRALELLLGGVTPCDLEALESTLFFFIFDLPFTREEFDAGLETERLQGELDQTYRARLKDAGSLVEVYRTRRPPDPEIAFRYVNELIARLARLQTSRFKQVRTPAKKSSELAHGQESARILEVSLRDADVDPLKSPLAGSAAEADSLVQQVQRYIRSVAEPVRIKIYLRAKVEEVQGTLHGSIPDRTTEKLFERAESTLYRDERALAGLAGAPTPRVLDTIEQVFDRWFRTEALPALQESLYKDPFAAYWYFVQTAAVAHAPVAFKDSRVSLSSGVFDLEGLKRLPLSQALARLRNTRIPSRFIEAHAVLERALSDVALTRDDALKQADAGELERGERAKLRRYLAAKDGAETLSTADVYGWVLRDSHKIGGKLDRDLVRATLHLLRQAKQERARQVVRELVESAPEEERERLAHYLETLSELMLELELRQATDVHFQEATTGGFTGWVLKRFLISTGVPVQLGVPGGVTGEEFADLLDKVAPRNKKSANVYHGKPATQVRFLHEGREFHQALLGAIDTSGSFLNMTSFDWKLDQGGKEIAYRLMGKKLGIEGSMFEDFLAAFRQGLPLEPGASARVLLYDMPPDRIKNLLVYFFMQTTSVPAIASVRHELEGALGGELTCPSVATCGDLSRLKAQAGAEYDARRASAPEYQQVWEVYRKLQSLFEDKAADLRATRPRASLAEYVADADRMQMLVRRYGRKRADDPARPFPINIIVDGKQDLFNLHFIRPTRHAPFFYADPFWNLFVPLYEFDIRLLMWKGALEFPWHFMSFPLPGRKIFHVLPFPFIPYPWLRYVPGFGTAGIFGSLLLQQMLAADPRTWWAMVVHAKSVSTDVVAIESGMGFATKYFDVYDEFLTWHDMGVEVRGPITGDVNDHFVQLFNEARVNNAGLPGSRKVKIPRLRYEDYRYAGPDSSGSRSWVFVTHPDKGDYSYRGAFMAALAAARKNIYIETPWLTDPLVAHMLLHKAREFRGRVNCTGLSDFECSTKMRDAVKIYLILPDATDQPALDVIGHADLLEMLHLGVKVYWWGPRRGWSARKMLHTKAWLIDYEEGEPALAYLGSANATQRSHLADNEIGIVSTSPEFAREVYERLFRNDLTTEARLEASEAFHFPMASRRLTRSGRRLQRLLVSMFWFF